MWLRNGEIAALGRTGDVVREYERFMVAKQKAAEARQASTVRSAPAAERPATGGLARIVSVAQLDGAGETPIYEPWAPFRLEVTFETADPGLAFHVGALIHAEDDTVLSALGSRVCGHIPLTGRRRYRVVMDVPNLPYQKGLYHLSVLLLDERGLHVHDRRQIRRAFGVVGHHWDPGPFGIGQRFLDQSAEDEARGD
jgi:hypothetical protein